MHNGTLAYYAVFRFDNMTDNQIARALNGEAEVVPKENWIQ